MSVPSWLDRALYPFEAHWMDVEGGRMHYVDEGEGPAVVLVHGTPTWSFLYRDLVRGLSRDHRVIAPDHIGFGLSEKPEAWGYRPEDHARNLSRLIGALGLRDFVLVVHDFGGPIGLSYAIENPAEIRALVLFNTWLWSLEENRTARLASRIAAGPVGKLLYRRLNFSPRVLLKSVMGDKSKLTGEVHRHYVQPFGSRREREGPWTLARELIGSSAWYDRLWSRVDRLASTPVLLAWGLEDPTFGPDVLDRWREALPAAEVETFPEAGHLVPEEVDDLGRVVRGFLGRLRAGRSAAGGRRNDWRRVRPGATLNTGGGGARLGDRFGRGAARWLERPWWSAAASAGWRRRSRSGRTRCRRWIDSAWANACVPRVCRTRTAGCATGAAGR